MSPIQHLRLQHRRKDGVRRRHQLLVAQVWLGEKATAILNHTQLDHQEAHSQLKGM